MSQMPDKIWLHKDTKYSTGDTVCGYQYKFLAENEGIENFVEYVSADAFIEKTEKWIDNFLSESTLIDYKITSIVRNAVIENFKNYMKVE